MIVTKFTSHMCGTLNSQLIKNTKSCHVHVEEKSCLYLLFKKKIFVLEVTN